MSFTSADGWDSCCVAELTDSVGVVSKRVHLHRAVTKYGVTTLYCEPVRERGELLYSLTHLD